MEQLFAEKKKTLTISSHEKVLARRKIILTRKNGRRSFIIFLRGNTREQ